MQRWKHAPDGSTWGEFGADDQRGRMNLVDRSKVLQGVAEVKLGKTFCLSLPLDVPGGMTMNPRRMPAQTFATLRDGKSAGAQGFCWSYLDEDTTLTDVVCDEVLVMNTQYSTQWDSLAHMGSRFDADGDGQPEAVFYNGFRAGVEIRSSKEDEKAPVDWMRFPAPRAEALGIENLAEHGAQGRGVMVDLEHHIGRRREAVGYERLMRILEQDRVEIEAGDMVCIHTGFADTLLAMNRQPDLKKLHETGSGLDGNDARLLNWIVDVRLSCLLADNPAVELVVPRLTQPTPIRGPRLPLHEHCLFKNGIHLGELWHLTPLAKWLREHGRSRFLLTAPPLRLPGAAGSPATPIATV
ncbi:MULTISPECIES: cyclase family protein [unclassified Variovorax]|jgi:kynurenine formamidase|uniref:cyclase family protein n=1 Tax=unclassified Variovorax TaxID=663243 RepID=UPI000D1314AB|nr:MULTISPECIES: cyclase family protein [unclassified Variovorax]AVQ80948.1 cyclase [Variovorax sp. PMC12]QRY29660.1 cyclase family protein [Variovorax sp. PDNC026]